MRECVLIFARFSLIYFLLIQKIRIRKFFHFISLSLFFVFPFLTPAHLPHTFLSLSLSLLHYSFELFSNHPPTHAPSSSSDPFRTHTFNLSSSTPPPSPIPFRHRSPPSPNSPEIPKIKTLMRKNWFWSISQKFP